MAQTPDKRRRTDLDLFILALVERGISTPYELQSTAGLSQGATLPALQRLLEGRLVRQGRPGARGRTDYKVTAAGKRTLKNGWLPLIEAGPSGNLDSDLRVALLAILGSGDHLMAADFLRKAANKVEAAASAADTGNSSTVVPLARWYTDIRLEMAKALLTAESQAIRATAKSLPARLSSKVNDDASSSSIKGS